MSTISYRCKEAVWQLKPLNVKLDLYYIPDSWYESVAVLTHPDTFVAWDTGSFTETYLLDHRSLVKDILYYFRILDQ